MTPSTQPILAASNGSQESLLAAGPEFVLFIAGGILTVFVVVFVTWLMLHAMREDRDARAAEQGSKAGSKGDA